MPFDLRADTFADRCGEQFTLTHDQLEGSLQLELVKVDPLAAPEADAPGVRPDPFSLDFTGPAEPVLPQSTYTLAHPELGEIQLFIVPRGPRDDKQQYQVVVN